MDTAIAVRGNGTVTITPDQTALIKKTIAKDATDEELGLFFYDCQRRGTHPLDKLIHFTKRGGKYTPVTGIDFMRARAAESGDYAGNDDAVFTLDAKGAPVAATATVYRIVGGQRVAFSATARWSEYYPGDQSGMMWRKMPHTMLAKCAEALALRKGFPQQLSGLYTVEEMDQATGEITTPKPVVKTAPVTTPTPSQKSAQEVFEADAEVIDAAVEGMAEEPALPDGAYELVDLIDRAAPPKPTKTGGHRFGYHTKAHAKWFNTFDTTLGAACEQFMKDKVGVILVLKDGQYGTDLISVRADNREEV